jgi:RNA 3'-terminal phosphate cyclase (ATP)
LFAEFKLHHVGFYPEGGGEFHATVLPHSEPPASVDVSARGTLLEAEVMSLVGGLAFEAAEKQGRAAESALREAGIYCEAENLPLPTTRSVGSVVFIRTQFEHTSAGFTTLGEKGASPESTGRTAA